MSNAAIQRAAEWQATRCKDDPLCIAEDRHKGDHRDITKSWPSMKRLDRAAELESQADAIEDRSYV